MKSLFLFLCLSASTFAQDMIYPVVYEGVVDIKGDPDLKWHKWSTQNFSILSIDETQGKFLAKNIEKIKGWCLNRWGMPKDEAENFKFSAECRIFCVSDKKLLSNLFRLEQSRVEIKRKNNKVEYSVIWLLLDDLPIRTIPIPVTEVCLAELSQIYNNKISYCLLRGMCLLNTSANNIRTELANLQKQGDKIYFSKALFEITFDQWEKLPADTKKVFDRESMILCLFLRKEFGETKMHHFFAQESRGLSPEEVLKSTYGFINYKQFDASFLRYIKDLCSDIVVGKTPDSYLEIKAKE